MHVTEDHLRQLAENRLPADIRQKVVRHLLTACAPCLELARKVLFPELEQTPDYTGVLRRLELSAVLAWNDVVVETGVARALWEHQFARLEPGLRLLAIRNNPDLHTCGMFDLLLTEARRLAREQPLASLDLAYAALAVADSFPPKRTARSASTTSGRAPGRSSATSKDWPATSRGPRRRCSPPPSTLTRGPEIPMRKRTSSP